MRKLIVIGCLISCLFYMNGSVSAKEQMKESEDPLIETASLSLTSEYAYIWNLDEELPIYEKSIHERMYPASLTKIMTTLVALESLDDLDEVISLRDETFLTLIEEGASVAGYQSGDQATVRDLLYGIMLPSGADAARAIAIRVAGSEEAYARKMNEKAVSLGMVDTQFVNTSGLHDDQHYTTAYDLSLLLKEALNNETFVEIFDAVQYHTELGDKIFYSTRLSSLAQAGLEEDILTGSKTGYTLEGGLCLAATMEVNNAHYMIITGNAGNEYGSGEHMSDAFTIHQYLAEHYEFIQISQADDILQAIPVRYGKQDTVDGVLSEDIGLLTEKGESLDFVMIEDEETVAPIEPQELIGHYQVTAQGTGITHIYEVYASSAVERDMLSYLFHSWWFYTVLMLPIIGIIMILCRKKQKLHH